MRDKQAAFIREYLIDFNGTQAAIRAGYSAKTANVKASQLLAIVSIREAIRSQITNPEDVLARLTDIAHGDMGEFMDITSMGFQLDLAKAKELGLTKLIKKVRQKTTTFLSKNESDEDREVSEIEIELYDAQTALITLGKFHKLFTERVEHTGEDGQPILIAAVAPGLLDKLKHD